jgi:pyridoxal phosphate enzyme (YggS family)
MAPSPSERALKANLERLGRRIEAARSRSPRSAASVEVVVVTKGVPGSALALLSEAGVGDVGENRVQEAADKRPGTPTGFRWHGIGHLQTNKARTAVEVFDVFHALDSAGLARRLETVLAPLDRTWPVYLQVNAAADPAKDGVDADEAFGLLEAATACPHLEVVGWMTMAALDADPRPAFRVLREVRDESVRRGIGRRAADGLSMGMSDDFEAAVEEGATVVRIGRAVWEGVLAVPPRAIAKGA